MWVRTRGLFSNVANYNYSLNAKSKLSDLGMEAQANVVADYFVLKTFGIREFLNGIQANHIGFNGDISMSAGKLCVKTPNASDDEYIKYINTLKNKRLSLI